MNWLEKLKIILSEDIEAAKRRESSCFDCYAGDRGIVLFGAGSLGRKIARGLIASGCKPLAFSDNNASMWGQGVEEIEVLPPSVAAQRHGGSAVFVIAIWHPSRTEGHLHLRDQLQHLGCDRVAPFGWLFWKYPSIFLPCYFWDLPSKLLCNPEEIISAFQLFHDAASKQEFVAQIKLRTSGDFSCLPPPSRQAQYFPEDLMRLSSEEFFVDCGAYDGDSLRDFISVTGGRFEKIVAFEPDPANCAVLEDFVRSKPAIAPRTTCYPWAVGHTPGRVRFKSSGLSSAAISKEGEAEVQCVSLDQALKDGSPTFVKMDIEGAELDALRGGADTIQRCKPKLAICAYHQQDHLWQIPLTLRELFPEVRLFLRAYCFDGLDLVCYAIPSEKD
jgi:FkbM family methyltransferase